MNRENFIAARFFKTSVDPSRRNIGLDMLRALCVVGVVLSHSNNLLGKHLPVYKFIFPLGPMAQEIFFSLSGFLVGRHILRFLNNNFRWSQLFGFYKRRWMRTIPFYFLFLFINYILYRFFYSTSGVQWMKADFKLSDFVFFIQNFKSAHPAFFPEIWTMPVLEWSYLLLPIPFILLIFIFPRLGIVHLITATIFLILAANAFRVNYVMTQNPELDWHLRKIVIYRLDALLYGFLLAILLSTYEKYFKKNYLPFFIIGALSTLFFTYAGFKFNHQYLKAFLYTILPLSAALMIPAFIFHTFPANKITAFFTHFSLIGYAILLSHLYFLQFCFIALFQPESAVGAWLVATAYLVFLVAFATLFYNFAERKFINVLKR